MFCVSTDGGTAKKKQQPLTTFPEILADFGITSLPGIMSSPRAPLQERWADEKYEI